jgi:hypothetical protein
MLTGRNNDPESRASLDVDVRIDAALADQPQRRQTFQQRRQDFRPLPDQHQDLGLRQPVGENRRILHMIVPVRHVMTRELAETRQRPHRVEQVIKNGDLHLECAASSACPRSVTSTRIGCPAT